MPNDKRDIIGPYQDESAPWGFMFHGQVLSPSSGPSPNWVMLTPNGDPEELNMKEVSLYVAGIIS
jgi:hypothetical protein